MAAPMPVLALRGSEGVWLNTGPPEFTGKHGFQRETSKNCKTMAFSNDGSKFAFCNGQSVVVQSMPGCKTLCELDKPKTMSLEFSPKGTYLATWEQYIVTKDQPQGFPNLSIWEASTGNLVKSFYQKKNMNWCPKWTADETICARSVNNAIHFFEGSFDTITHKLHLQKVTDFELAKAGPPYHVSAYVYGTKGQPSFVRLFQYPNFAQWVAQKSFFRADKVDMFWNSRGNACVVLTSCETSGGSYYGDQGLLFLKTNGDTCMVERSKNGPIYHIEWNPNGTEFCVVYGYMPSKASLYNMKAEPTFDFGTGARNLAYYNPQGNILCLCGFGNLRGNLEFWDTKNKKQICNPSSPDTTLFKWSPDGEHIVMATTAPRLRVGNCYKVWHYSGVILFEKQVESNQELWDATWQPAPPGRHPEKPVRYSQVEKPVEVAQPQAKVAAYRPPGAQGTRAKFKLHEEEPKPASQAPQSKNALRNQRKKAARKAKQEQEGGEANEGQRPQSAAAAAPSAPAVNTGDPELDKQIRKIRKKLQAIETLREQQSAGKTLEANQLEKIKGEDALLKELEALEIR